MEQTYYQTSHSDLFVFLEFYFMVAHSNLESVIKDIKRAKNSLNFWHNFALNFKDETFVKFITIKSEHDNKEFIQSKLHEILKMILNFLKENLSSKDKFSKLIETNVFDYLEILMSFLDIFENVSASKASSLLSDSMRNTFRQCFINFNSYSKIDLYKLLEALYEKVGYAFLDFKGNFIWADKYSSNVLFEQDKIPEYNLFEMMTDYSQFIIRNKFGDSFYDFKKESSRIVNFSYSINILKEDKLMTASTDHFFSKLFNNLNNTKTLTSRASTILIQSKEDNKPYPCILLETKLASFRQNFDFFYWRCYLN